MHEAQGSNTSTYSYLQWDILIEWPSNLYKTQEKLSLMQECHLFHKKYSWY